MDICETDQQFPNCSSKQQPKTDSCTNCYSRICGTCQIRQDFLACEASAKKHSSELYVDQIYTCNECDQSWMDLFSFCVVCGRLVCGSFKDRHESCSKVYGLMKSDIIKRRQLADTQRDFDAFNDALNKSKEQLQNIRTAEEDSAFLTELKKSVSCLKSGLDNFVEKYEKEAINFQTKLSEMDQYLEEQISTFEILKGRLANLRKNDTFPVQFLQNMTCVEHYFQRLNQNHSQIDLNRIKEPSLASLECKKPDDYGETVITNILGIRSNENKVQKCVNELQNLRKKLEEDKKDNDEAFTRKQELCSLRTQIQNLKERNTKQEEEIHSQKAKIKDLEEENRNQLHGVQLKIDQTIQEKSAEVERLSEKIQQQYETIVDKIFSEKESEKQSYENQKQRYVNELQNLRKELKEEKKEVLTRFNAKFTKYDSALYQSFNEIKKLVITLGTSGLPDAVIDQVVSKYKYQNRNKTAGIYPSSFSNRTCSKVVADKSLDSEPEVVTPYDPYRPLFEMYTILFNEDWKDAYEQCRGSDEDKKQVVSTLLDLFQKIWVFCKEMAEEQFDQLENTLLQLQLSKDESCTLSPGSITCLNEIRRKSARDILPYIYQKFQESNPYVKNVSKRFVDGCLKLCWYSAIRDPPLDYGFQADNRIKDFRAFTKHGTEVDYVMWPAMYLCPSGTLLSKGIVKFRE